MTRALIVACVWLMLLPFFSACRSSHQKPTSPRPKAIVLVTIDTLRADAVSFAGQQPDTTPFLRSLAEQGVVYSRAYAPCSWTAPSMASLMTGVLPRTHGVRRGLISRTGQERKQQVIKQAPLPDELETLAEKVKAAGFTTVGVPANLHLSARLGFAQGFDAYLKEAPFLDGGAVNAQVARLMQQALGDSWRQRWHEQPTFLWVHYFDPHMPYEARKPWVLKYAPDFESEPGKYEQSLSAEDLAQRYARQTAGSAPLVRPLYLSEVSYVDEQLRRLNDTLHFDDPNVLLIVTADHGEELNDHQRFGHGLTLFEEVVHVPLMIRWPAVIAPQRSDQPVSLIDVYPTVLSLLGLDVPPTSQGRALPSSAAGGDDRVLVFESDRARPPVEGLRRGDWKLIRRQSGQGAVARPPHLFNLREDPSERDDRAPREPNVVAEMDQLLSDRLSALPAASQQRKAVPVGNDPASDERLRALGYQ